jgi:HTH-type transcriptional regulator/antitoxin HigA
MKTKLANMTFDKLPKDYAGLIGFLMPRPISDNAELENATEIIDLMAGHDLNKDQEDYLDLMSDLVDKYEAANNEVKYADLEPVDALRYLMQENGMSASAIGRLLGDRALGSRILNGQRSISKKHARLLAEQFAVNIAVFL